MYLCILLIKYLLNDSIYMDQFLISELVIEMKIIMGTKLKRPSLMLILEQMALTRKTIVKISDMQTNFQKIRIRKIIKNMQII